MKKLLFFVLLLSSLSASSQETNQINVISEAWVGATHEDGTGFYFDLLRLIYEPEGLEVIHHIAPYQRSVLEVKFKKMDAWVASYEQEENTVIYPKQHMDFDSVTALYKKSAIPNWRGKLSLENQKVGWIRGYSYNDYLEFDMNWHELNNRSSAVGMLRVGRIDAYLDEMYEIEEIIEKANLDMNLYATDKILDLKLFMAFANTPKGERLADIWDERMTTLMDSGELKTFWEEADYSTYPFSSEALLEH